MIPTLNAVYFNHGKESGPWGIKIIRLARLAASRGFQVQSPDYRAMATADERLEHLLGLNPAALDRLVLVGSSMGGYVAAAAAEKLQPRGLFLMAPAVDLPGYATQGIVPRADVAVAVHGWHDEVVPVEKAICFCRRHHMDLHLIAAGHTLRRALPTVETLFEMFLERVLAE
jgi:alpha-beta hydrolase superfamily lysophospholipase